jgi:hypothetical protein
MAARLKLMTLLLRTGNSLYDPARSTTEHCPTERRGRPETDRAATRHDY